MIHLLFLAEKTVKLELPRLAKGGGLTLVTGVKHGAHMKSPAEREPHRSLDHRFGPFLTQLVVVDEGKVEGMWRDPLGDLADGLYPDSRDEAYAAATGYLLLEGGRPFAVVKKGAPEDDLWFLQEALSRKDTRVPPPDPSARPKAKKKAPEASSTGGPGGRRIRDDEPTPPRGTRAGSTSSSVPAEPERRDPFDVLGLSRNAGYDEAKKAFRALVTQYHPDKVSHLAPEFRVLAETRTRELLAAWEELEKLLTR